MKTLSFPRAALLCASLVLSAAADAEELVYTSTIPLRSTGFSQDFTLPKFDPALGALTGIGLTLRGDLAGFARAESLNAEPRTVNLRLAATIALVDPASNVRLATASPFVERTFDAAAFDGAIDFGGTSGATFSKLSGTASTILAPSLDPSLAALFVGTGDAALRLEAGDASSSGGVLNVVAQFVASAGGSVAVTYAYTPVPEPATMAVLGFGVAALSRRRRKA